MLGIVRVSLILLGNLQDHRANPIPIWDLRRVKLTTGLEHMKHTTNKRSIMQMSWCLKTCQSTKWKPWLSATWTMMVQMIFGNAGVSRLTLAYLVSPLHAPESTDWCGTPRPFVWTNPSSFLTSLIHSRHSPWWNQPTFSGNPSLQALWVPLMNLFLNLVCFRFCSP